MRDLRCHNDLLSPWVDEKSETSTENYDGGFDESGFRAGKYFS